MSAMTFTGLYNSRCASSVYVFMSAVFYVYMYMCVYVCLRVGLMSIV